MLVPFPPEASTRWHFLASLGYSGEELAPSRPGPWETFCKIFPSLFPHLLSDCRIEWGPRKSVWSGALASPYGLSWTLRRWRNTLYYVYLLRCWGWLLQQLVYRDQEKPVPFIGCFCGQFSYVPDTEDLQMVTHSPFPVKELNRETNKEANNITSKSKSIKYCQIFLLKSLKSMFSSVFYLFQRILDNWFLSS